MKKQLNESVGLLADAMCQVFDESMGAVESLFRKMHDE